MMLRKIIKNPINNIAGQLQMIVVVLSIFSIFNLVTLYRQASGASGDSRVVNYTGIVRGKTQRLIKLAFLQEQLQQSASSESERPTEANVLNGEEELAIEPEAEPETESEIEPDNRSLQALALNVEVQQKINEIIPELNQIMTGLMNGDEELKLAKLRDPAYQTNMKQLQEAWEQLKIDLASFLDTPTPQKRTQLLKASETYWDLTNKTTFSAEAHAEKNVRNSRRLTVMINLSILAIIFVISKKLRATLTDTVTNLTTSSSEISATVTQQDEIAKQQVTSVKEAKNVMDGLEASSTQASEQASSAVAAAQQAFQASEEGAQTVSKSKEGMFVLETKM
ncbi:MAG: hypothetical protein F6K42_23495, partial [Leptolyngbya sp. SIO1D8]|nr:hypothetical protein [Leptolyngbya sp. SIO1D8]